jgi:hypothetical protein
LQGPDHLSSLRSDSDYRLQWIDPHQAGLAVCGDQCQCDCAGIWFYKLGFGLAADGSVSLVWRMADTRSIRVKLQIYCGDEIAMGPGKADLLDAIAATGSISAGARAMGMSYRRAWMLVDTLNRCWDQPVVETFAGGSRRLAASSRNC